MPSDRDFEPYAAFFEDEAASSFYGGPIGAAVAWSRLPRDIGHWHLRGYGQWSIIRKDDGSFVESVGNVKPEGCPQSELTWWIGKSSRRMGFAREASLEAIRFGFDVLGWELDQTHMKDENVAARSFVLSLGGQMIERELFPDGASRNVHRLPYPQTVERLSLKARDRLVGRVDPGTILREYPFCRDWRTCIDLVRPCSG